MKKSLVACALASTLCVFALAGCGGSGTTFSDVFGNTTVELNGLSGEVEGDFELTYTDVAIDVELEQGTVDIEIVDIIRTRNDEGPDDITPLDVIYEAQGVKDGDHLTFSDDDGDIMVRLTSSDGATGVLTFTENEG